MGFWIGGGNKEVVHINDKLTFSNHVLEGVIHESLEHGRGVAETKEYNHGFEESFMGDGGRFPLVTILDMDIVVSPTNVELSKVASVFQLVHEVRDEGKGVGVTSDVFVEVSVVLAGAEFTIFLLNKEEGGCLKGELEG